MRSAEPLATDPDFSIRVVTCDDDHRDWSPPEVRDHYGVVLVRRGRFRLRSRGAVADVDPTLAYLNLAGAEESFAHPAGGDVCTSLRVSPALWRELAGDPGRADRATFYVDAWLDLAHRRVLAAAGEAGGGLDEELLRLLSTIIARVVSGPVPGGGNHRGDRALVAAAREAIVADRPEAGGLLPLARALGVSPYRLSRAFPRELGVSLTRYRNRVRVGRALDRIEAGDTNLGRLAADLGFADQAHLCRTVRAHVGHTPTAVRRALAPATGQGTLAG